MMLLKPYLKFMLEHWAADLFITGDSVPQVRINGSLKAVGKEPLAPDVVSRAAGEIMGEREQALFERDWNVDFGLHVDGLGRFRVNVFRQRQQVAIVFRSLQPEVPRIEQLRLPSVLYDLAMARQGLVLITGPTGSGKSTTLAAMIGHRNEKASGHILTIEDPIEFAQSSKRSIVNQREVGIDARSYSSALRSALRESPDVVMIGEARDSETLESVIELAGTGQLSLTTLHANSAAQTLDRITNMFPADRRPGLLMDLSLYLRAIISQRLVISKKGERVPAVEVMLNTPHIAEQIRQGQFDRIQPALEEARSVGLRDMDTALLQLYRHGVIEKDEALANAHSRNNLESRINFAG